MHPSLISASELQAELGKAIVILDCRFNLMDKSQGLMLYRQGHIPGAFYVDLERDLSSAVQTHGGRHPLPNLEHLQEKWRSFGINQLTTVVVYDDSRMAYAARAWWLLKFMGHTDVRILNGGFNAWIANKGAIDRRDPALKQGNFKMDLQQNKTVSRDDILNDNSIRLIDSREPRRFQGLEEPIDPVAGHIPNALNFFWQHISDDQGFIKSIDSQKKHWDALPTTNNLAVYCGSGVTACVNIFLE
ncbi:MAG: sulfurtransferase [Moraxellaceae bacterium]|nr:MAG: sulfurtransferase [Moraxellaceae bacterium]